MFIVTPAIGFSAFLLIPSSIALLNLKLRENTYFKGKFWCSIWAVNILLSIGYIIVGAYIGYIYLISMIGN
jgi:multisubunit Na+/H+ antiporter MnhB subunit